MEIQRYRGDTAADQFSVFNKSAGDVASLAGCTFTLTVGSVMNPTDDTTMLYQLTGVVDTEKGTVYFEPSDDQVNRVGVFYYDIQMVDSNGKKRTLVKDVYEFIQDISKN